LIKHEHELPSDDDHFHYSLLSNTAAALTRHSSSVSLTISTTNSSVQQINDSESYTEEDENIQELSSSI